MPSSFNYYPIITYNNRQMRNIISHAEIVSVYVKDYTKFYTYVIKENERPDMIAYREYNDPTLDWILYVINNVTDPYYDWVMDDKKFIQYMESKYNTAAYKLTSTVIPTSIAYYYYTGTATDSAAEIAGYNYTLEAETYTAIGSPAGWTAKSIWDYEFELNEQKRTIKILNPSYVNEFKNQFKELFD